MANSRLSTRCTAGGGGGAYPRSVVLFALSVDWFVKYHVTRDGIRIDKTKAISGNAFFSSHWTAFGEVTFPGAAAEDGAGGGGFGNKIGGPGVIVCAGAGGPGQFEASPRSINTRNPLARAKAVTLLAYLARTYLYW